MYQPHYNSNIPPQNNVPVTATPTTTPVPDDIVFVTPGGGKYHRADCQYTKDKDCTALARSEAMKNYSPCKVCKP